MKYFFFLLLLTSAINLSAQQKQFAKDEQGKFIYYKVVDSQVLSKAVLQERAVKFVNEYYKKQLKQTELSDSVVKATGKVIIDKTLLVAGHPSGEVNYYFTFEVKQGKYRFWLTDFTFIPYKRDRYGNFVASTTVSSPLEKSVGKLNANEWVAIQASTYAKTVKFGEDFVKYLATDAHEQPKVKKEAPVSTRQW